MKNGHESVGRARVLDTRREGAFIVKILAPEMNGRPIEPNSEEAFEAAAGHKKIEKENPRSRRADTTKKGYSRR
jgi:hypothetical protein